MNCLTHCWWQILAATVAYWMIGALWYYPKVFGTIWQKSHGMPEMTEEKKKEVGMMMPPIAAHIIRRRIAHLYFVVLFYVCIMRKQLLYTLYRS